MDLTGMSHGLVLDRNAQNLSGLVVCCRAECDIQNGSLLTRLTLETTGVIINLCQMCSCSDAVS